ncbi:MAG TPA: hypothetical protein VGN59_16965 [Acidimicrobiia bacterium]
MPGARWITVGLWALLTVPFVVALVALAHPHWYPVLDMAQTELRIRDVWSAHPPLIGLPGRIGTIARQGSHPGPISFWLLSPFYRLFGASAWAMDAAAICLNVLVIGAMLWLARRRGGVLLLLGFAAVLAVLLAYYGPVVLTLAWNPYMPVLWWLLFVLAVWSVLCDDWALLPVVVLAGTFCAQTHISYVALVGGLGVLAGAWMAVTAYRHRSEAGTSRRFWAWGLGSIALAGVLWLPPVIQEFTGSPANFSILWDYFTQTPQQTIGAGEAAKLVLRHLNPVTLFSDRDGMTGSVVPGLFVGAVWVGGVVAAWRMRARDLLRLDLVLAVAGVLGVFSAARIFGYVWFYLVLWSWGIAALMLLTIGWTVALLAARTRTVERSPRRAATWLAGALAVVTVGGTIAYTVDASDAVAPDAQPTRVFGHLIGPTVASLEAGKLPGTGRDGRYMVTFTDALNIGANAYGLVLELERQGLHAGLPTREVIIPNRKVTPDDATAVVHLAVGPANIARWRAKPGVSQVAFYDPRSPAQKAEYARLRAEVVRRFRAAGQDTRAREVDNNLFVAIYQPHLPKGLKPVLERMLVLGQPSAIFVGPPVIDPADN